MSTVTVKFKDRVPGPHSFFVGMDGEHNAEVIRFEGLPVYSPEQMTLLNLVIGETIDVIDVMNDEVTLTRNHTVPGTMIGWITIQVGTALVWKSEKIYMTISDLPDISDPIEQQYPTAFEQIIAQTGENVTAAQAAQTAAETAQGKAEDAQDAAESARADAVEAKEDAETAAHAAQQAQALAETAQGKAEDAQSAAETAQTAAETAQGKAETAQGKAEEAQGYAETARDATIRIASEAGQARDQAVAARDQVFGMSAQAETLQPGSQATASYSQGVLSLGIPRGADGQDGQDGEDGYSPSASVTKSGDTVTITITDKSGTTTAEVTSPQIDVATIAETQTIISEYGEDEDMLCETTWEYNSGNPYFVSVDDAADIADAFTTGKGVTFHMPSGTGEGSPSELGIMNDIYVRLLAYEPGYTDGQGNDQPDLFEFAASYTGAGNIDLINGINVGQDGKLHFDVYVAPTPKGGVK